MGETLKNMLVGSALGIASLATSNADANVIMNLDYPASMVVGNTYEVNVTADTTAQPSTKVNEVDFKLAFDKNYFDFVNSSLPVANDFFAGYTMAPAYNFVGSTASNGLVANTGRATGNGGNDGPSNTVGEIASFYLTPTAVGTPNRFNLSLADVYDTLGNDYYNTQGLTINRGTAPTITPAPEPASLALMAAGLGLLYRRRRRMEETPLADVASESRKLGRDAYHTRKFVENLK